MMESRLFKPIKLGDITLEHRIVMSPTTRFRADDDHVPLPFVTDYYSQRASTPGTLLITEGTYITLRHGGFPNVPGIWNDDQIVAWKKITDTVHSKGSYIFLQLWAMGRTTGSQDFGPKEAITVIAPSAITIEEGDKIPQELTVEEIRESVQEYAQGAKNAMKAGFDGVEIAGGNGYLIDQFIQDVSNQRTDEYGGSIENRNRFAIEVTKAVVDAVGASRTGFRLSPWSVFQGMRMKDPIPQFEDLIRKLDEFGLAYLHLIESRVAGTDDATAQPNDSLDFAFKLISGPALVAGGFNPHRAKEMVDNQRRERDVAVVFGRYFIATPDLVYRIQNGIELNKYDRASFFLPKSEKGYVDYPFSAEFLASQV